jgi:hypothetical protein
MPFRRFFSAKDNPKPEVRNEPADAPESIDESDESDEAAEQAVPAEHDESDWLTRARAVLPTGASTGSKRIEALYGDADSTGPTH